jgi:threonine/homoserine/homoserine lactone efflux protein
MLATLLLFWGAFALAVISPGPNFAVLLATGTRDGRGPALRTAIGFVIGEAAWGFAAVFGVAALVTAHPWLGTALRIGGGAFLSWMGVQALRAALRDAPPPRVGVAGGASCGASG